MKFSKLERLYLALAFIIFGCHPARKIESPAVVEKIEIIQPPKNTARTDSFLLHILQRYPSFFDTLLKDKSRQVQIIYTQIDRDEANRPHLTNYYVNVDSSLYFYPASTVKLPVAALALQRLNELAVPGLTRTTTMIIDAAFEGQTAVYNDPTTEDGRPTIEQYIKKILLVSDNDAFNRLYEFLGQEYINNSLHKMGYDSAEIIHRLNISLPAEQNRYTNPVSFYNAASKAIYTQPLVHSQYKAFSRSNFLGNGYYQGNELVNAPFDFSKKNRLPLTDLHSILQSIIFPETVPQKQRFNLTPDDRYFLLKYMSTLPRESTYPQYDSTYNDAYVKFLLLGGKDNLPDGVRIFNKPGDAYGFLTDAAYIVDFKNGVEFLLSATILCNPDGSFNDDKYDYEAVGLPFMKNLGHVLYDYELSRPRKHVPNLSDFKITYGF